MIRIGIYGYGNLGKACERAVKNNPDMKLTAIFTRRDVTKIKPETEGVKVINSYDVMNAINIVDVMINCGGSATDLPHTTAFLARHFNIVDSFDNHSKVNEHFKNVDFSAKESGNVALICGGWDPGLFSVMRTFFSSFLPCGNVSTFWGEGISQGHSEAIRHIHGVKDARQYTVPDEAALEKARTGEIGNAKPQQMHKRVCYVSLDENAYKDEVEEQIKNIPDYFLGYDTQVNFVSDEELKKEHSRLYHGGYVISNGLTGNGENRALMEMKLKLDSNPEFTAGVLTAYARAVFRAACRSERGCLTVLDVAPADLSPLDKDELRKNII